MNHCRYSKARNGRSPRGSFSGSPGPAKGYRRAAKRLAVWHEPYGLVAADCRSCATVKKLSRITGLKVLEGSRALVHTGGGCLKNRLTGDVNHSQKMEALMVEKIAANHADCPEAAKNKKSYKRPTLEVFGGLHLLTQGSGGAQGDVGPSAMTRL